MIRSFVLMATVSSILFLTSNSLHAQCNEIIITGQPASGLNVREYYSKRHWRFHYLGDRDFIGEEYGWTGGFSGIGRMVPVLPDPNECSNPQDIDHIPLRWVTMVTPSFGVTVRHVVKLTALDPCKEALAKGRDVKFYHDNDPCGSNYETREIEKIFQVASADLAVVQFTAPVSSSVRKFRIRIPSTNFVGNKVLVVGRDFDHENPNHVHRADRVVNQRFGTSTITQTGLGFDTLVFLRPYVADEDPNAGPDDAYAVPGDSGAPNFLFAKGGMYLIGVNQTSNGSVEIYSYYTEIQDIIQATGSTETLVLSGGDY